MTKQIKTSAINMAKSRIEQSSPWLAEGTVTAGNTVTFALTNNLPIFLFVNLSNNQGAILYISPTKVVELAGSLISGLDVTVSNNQVSLKNELTYGCRYIYIHH